MKHATWNAYLDQVIAANLTRNEYRLALTLGRYLLGWNRTSAALGRDLLAKKAGFVNANGQPFRKTLEDTRDSLIQKGIISITGGRPGRGNRTTYTLTLPPTEKAEPPRPKPASQKRPSHHGQNHAEKAEPPRPRSTTFSSTSRTAPKTIQTLAVEAYTSTGGSLHLTKWRQALTAQATHLHKTGTTQDTILAAARQLGSEHAFPGYLTQRAQQFQTAGGPCNWDGHHRQNLTQDQLATCPCNHCRAWLAYAIDHQTNKQTPLRTTPENDGRRATGDARKRVEAS